ncbi:hypothetical protein OA77_29595, partial [Pseudomonas coronafaciens]
SCQSILIAIDVFWDASFFWIYSYRLVAYAFRKIRADINYACCYFWYGWVAPVQWFACVLKIINFTFADQRAGMVIV